VFFTARCHSFSPRYHNRSSSSHAFQKTLSRIASFHRHCIAPRAGCRAGRNPCSPRSAVDGGRRHCQPHCRGFVGARN
jgi:hypothetical protein